MPYVIQDLNDRVWVVDEGDFNYFLLMAGRAGNHQDMLDELALDHEVMEALFEQFTGDDMWQLNPVEDDQVAAFRTVSQEILDSLMIVPVTPAEMRALEVEVHNG